MQRNSSCYFARGTFFFILSISFSTTPAQQVPTQSATQPPMENSSKVNKKQVETDLKQIIAEGKTLEQQGKLAAARDRYVDAEGILSTSDARTAISRIDDQQKQRLESLLEAAHHSYEMGQIADSLEQLQRGLEVQASHAALEYDLALCYARLSDRAKAALYLDDVIGALPNGKERTRVLELRSAVLMGTPASDPAEEARTISSFNATYLQEEADPGDRGTAGGNLCEQTKQLRDAFPENAAVVFNSAKCADEDAASHDAADLLGDYLKLAPQALDRGDAELLQKDLSSLASLGGDSGNMVRRNYATAARYLDYRRYDRAIGEYEKAAQVLPEYPQTQWKLGLLYEASGNISKAREHFLRFQQLELDSERRSASDTHVSLLEGRRAIYNANVGEAQDVLSDLLSRAMGLDTEGNKHKAKLNYRQWRWASKRYKATTRASERLSKPYVERELNMARGDLLAAGELFPLGAEANELLALIYLQGNDWPEAYRSYDAVASQGLPISFYAQANSARNSKVVRATKVEIGSDAVRLVYLSSYDPKKQISMPPNEPAGEDDLGNLVVSAAQPPDAHAEALTIRAADLKAIATDKNFVVLKLQNDQIYLAPLDMQSEVPFEGGASRTFGNEYTRLFNRYLGYEDAKLGKEGMTTGEKFKLGFEVARIGVSLGMMGMGTAAVYGSAIRMAELMHALAVYHSVMQGIRAVNVADAALRLADDLQVAATTLERTTTDERQAVEGMEFKIIPTEPVHLKFREKF